MKTVDHYLTNPENNFNLMRFVAATMVIWSHSFALSDKTVASDPLVKIIGVGFAGLAVNIFFAISGFLIVRSWVTHDNLGIFIRARCLRIFPGLVFAVLFCAFVIGPAYSTLDLANYFSHKSVYNFIYSNVTLYERHPFLPGVFVDNPRLGINGSLWSLYYELVMYLAVLILGYLGLFKSKYKIAFLFFLFLTYYIFIVGHHDLAVQHLSTQISKYERLSLYFFLGGLFYLLREHIPLSVHVLFGLTIVTFVSIGTNMFSFFLSISLTYFVLWFAFVPKGKIHKFNTFKDYSYGIYIYAYPVQQMLIASVEDISVVEIFIYAFFITLLLANISTRFIEEPAMKLNNYFVKKYYKNQPRNI